MSRHIPTSAQLAIAEASRHWPPPSPNSRKVACPVCGATGYERGSWTWNHIKHTQAACGRWTTRLGTHAAHCPICLDRRQQP